MKQAAVLDIRQFIDEQPFSRYQLRIAVMCGALLCGPLADRFGRKPVLVGCTLAFGFGALLTATATSLESLLLFRLFTGLGLGGAMPNAIALTSEYAPKRFR